MLEKTRRTALSLLTRRDHSRQELTKKLKLKGYQASDIESVVADLAASGLQCDQRFAENFVHWRRQRGYGPICIILELQARGIADETIAEVVQIADNAWLTEVRDVWRKHFKGRLPATLQEKAKQMRFLQHRGFAREHINSILKDNYGHEE